MPRRRTHNPLGLPPNVYFKHGAFYFQHPLTRKWERIGTDLAQAKARGEHLNDPNGLMGTLGWYADEFIAWCAERVAAGKLAPRTLADYRTSIVPIKAYAGHMPPSDIRPHHVQAYLDLGVELDRSVRANRDKSCLSAIMSWIRTRRPEAEVVANPCFGVRRNRETPDNRYVEHHELNAVMAIATPAMKAYATLVYRTLQRPSDVLTWTRANIRTRTIDGRAVRVIAFKQSKTQQELEIEIDATLAEVIDGIKRDVIGMPLIHTRRAGEFTESGAASMWRRYCNKVKVETFGIMQLRGKGATDMYQAGVPLEKIQALMGHESVTTTEIYIKRRLKFIQAPNQVKVS